MMPTGGPFLLVALDFAAIPSDPLALEKRSGTTVDDDVQPTRKFRARPPVVDVSN